MAYQFTPDLETKNILIDQQHRELIRVINALLEACAVGKGRAHLEETANYLYSYTEKHFSDEEKLQIQCRYPDFAHHKALHEGFKKTVREIVAELSKQGPTIVLVGKINNSLASWLVSHIKGEDKKLAEFIRKQG